MTDPMELVGRIDGILTDNGTDYHPILRCALTEAAACIREMVEWRPIETAPVKRLVDVWALGPGKDGDEEGYRIADCWKREEGVWFSMRFGEISASKITHWLPLPPAPGAEA